MKPPNITVRGTQAGLEAEEWAATLPNMRKRSSNEEGKHDLVHVPSTARIECKYSYLKEHVHRYSNASITYSFSWSNIREDRFDWLLLLGQREDLYHYWLLRPTTR
jgi:hypothetical protein